MFNIFNAIARVHQNLFTAKSTAPATSEPEQIILHRIGVADIQPIGSCKVIDVQNTIPVIDGLTRVEMTFENELPELLTKHCQMDVASIVGESVGFLDWATQMAMQGREISSIHTKGGIIIAAVDPKDGSYIEADIQSLRNIRNRLAGNEPGMAPA